MQDVNSDPLKPRATRADTSTASDSSPRFSFLALPTEIQEKVGLLWTDYPLGLPTDALNTHLFELFYRPSSIARRALARFGEPARALLGEFRSSAASRREQRIPATDILIQLCDAMKGHLDYTFVLACEAGDQKRVDMLLRAGVDQRRLVLNEALLVASQNGHLTLVELLLNAGANVHAHDDAAIYQAAVGGHTEAVRSLLNWGADLSHIGDEVLSIASSWGQLELVALILDTSQHFSPRAIAMALMSACERGAVDVISYLLSKGALIESGAFDSFHIACQQGHTEAARTLLDSDAGKMYLQTPNALRNTFNEAVEEGRASIVELLAERGVDIHANRNLAFRTACQKGHIGVVKVLLTKGADVHAQKNDALHQACVHGHSDVVSLLLDHGADLHTNHERPLRWAIERQQVEIVKLLIERGANASIAVNDLVVQRAERTGNTDLEARGHGVALQLHSQVQKAPRMNPLGLPPSSSSTASSFLPQIPQVQLPPPVPPPNFDPFAGLFGPSVAPAQPPQLLNFPLQETVKRPPKQSVKRRAPDTADGPGTPPAKKPRAPRKKKDVGDPNQPLLPGQLKPEPKSGPSIPRKKSRANSPVDSSLPNSQSTTSTFAGPSSQHPNSQPSQSGATSQQGGLPPGFLPAPGAAPAPDTLDEDEDEVLDPTFQDVQKLLYKSSDQQTGARTCVFLVFCRVGEGVRDLTWSLPDGVVRDILSRLAAGLDRRSYL
ncbi:hypothetical protein HDU93_002464 [Gonapodya sp. JEL0774]|nr:hypothetical protein HDU93_002464 [Gonapodya sp. JEL0774]